MINRIHIGIMARSVILEARRRRDVGVLGFFAGLFLLFLGAARVVGFDNPATATFLLNLSLTLVIGLTHLVALVLSARQLPDELEQRTLYPLLARPVRRSEVLLAKWLASTGAAIAVFALLVMPALVLVPRLESFQAATLVQLLLLQPLALAVTTALAMTFSLLLPRAPGFFLAALLVFGAGGVIRFSGGRFWAHLLPAPGRLSLALRYTDGVGPLPLPEFVILVAYALLWTGLLLAASIFHFQRRSLP